VNNSTSALAILHHLRPHLTTGSVYGLPFGIDAACTTEKTRRAVDKERSSILFNLSEATSMKGDSHSLFSLRRISVSLQAIIAGSLIAAVTANVWLLLLLNLGVGRLLLPSRCFSRSFCGGPTEVVLHNQRKWPA
jgi:hypothetical protein